MKDKMELPQCLLWYKKVTDITSVVVCICFIIFHFIDATRTLGSFQLRCGHLMFAFMVTFLIFPAVKSPKNRGVIMVDVVISGVLALLSIVVMLYSLNYFLYEAKWRAGIVTWADITVGITMILLALEGTRRHHGIALPGIALIFIIYAFVGSHIPIEFLSHRGFGYERIFTYLGPNTTEGILGIPVTASASYVAMFLFFGAFLKGSGASEIFNDIAFKFFGTFRGGPAKAATVGSLFFGMISGSAIANVASTGAVTIPLMKKVGYKAHFAGAVEACASTGGQFMPPLMGAAAFIMAEFLGVSYITVMKVAFLPALLFYLALLWAVHFEAAKTGLKGLSKEGLPSFKSIAERIYLLLPILILVYMLIGLYWSPSKSAFWAILSMWLLSMMKASSRMGFKKLKTVCVNGARAAAGVGTICACAGIVIGVINMTGLGLSLSNILVYMAQGSLPLLLILSMFTSIVLGMGLTTSAVYIILAVLVAPALISLGVNPLAAHLFLVYFGCISCITPPVAVAAYAGAGIAGSNPLKTALTASRLGLSGFIVPFVFIYNNNLLMLGHPTHIIIAIVTGLAAVMFLSAGSEGYLLTRASLWQRILLIGAGLTLIVPDLVTDLIGLGLGGVVALVQWLRKSKIRQSYTAVPEIK